MTRPLIAETPAKRRSVSLPDAVVESLKFFGLGNLSAGIREGEKALRREEKASKIAQRRATKRVKP